MDMADLWSRGSHLVAEHDLPVSLAKTAELVLSAVTEFPTFGLVAASGAAERVLGAMMVISPELRVGLTDDVVIFDVNIASGTVLARAADRLRRQGHTGAIVAMAVHALCDVPEAIEGTDRLVVLDGSALQSQESQGRHQRLLVAL